MNQTPPPNSRDLLLPLLACLPASFASPKPPPALIPLLSPLLRQRVNFLSVDSNGSNGWLPLLSWDPQRGAKLPAIVQRLDLEPHPISGELEMDEVRPAKYRRLDAETLHSRFEVEQFHLLPTYVWCESDEHGEMGPGWRLTELKSLDEKDNEGEWFESQAEANVAATSAAGTANSAPAQSAPNVRVEQADNEDDNDDYWASYDRTPAPTPGRKLSTVPTQIISSQATEWPGSKSEMDYYERYGAEVQPAMDAHDPDEEATGLGESTLKGDVLFQQDSQLNAQADAMESHVDLSMPRPITPASSHSSIDKLEAQAEAMSRSSSAAEAENRAQLGVRQHISTDMKSLFRLAKSMGMDRAEFQRIVQTELEVLVMLEQDE